jgi:hypothetical protein
MNYSFYCETNACVHTLTPMNTHTPSPTGKYGFTVYTINTAKHMDTQQNMHSKGSYEVTVDASLPTETSPPTKKIFRLFIIHQSIKLEV